MTYFCVFLAEKSIALGCGLIGARILELWSFKVGLSGQTDTLLEIDALM
jgi:hypothetical protein